MFTIHLFLLYRKKVRSRRIQSIFALLVEGELQEFTFSYVSDWVLFIEMNFQLRIYSNSI